MKWIIYNGTDGVYKLITNSTTKMGGAAKLQLLIAETLVKNGNEVIVITPISKGKELVHEVNGIKFVSTPLHTISFKLIKILFHEKPDWVYWHTNSIHIGVFFFIAKMLRIKSIYACASDKDCIPRYAINPYSKKKFLWPLYRWGLNQADRIFIQHTRQGEMLGPKYSSKTYLVNNILNPHSIVNPELQSGYIAWIANIRVEKRPDLLLEIAKRMPQNKFVMGGDVIDFRSIAGYGQDIINRLSTIPNIDYLGPVKPEDVLPLMSNASLFLSTSDQEGFPNTMLESWSVGVPVVSMNLDIGGLIITQQMGYVTQDIEDTVSTINQLMSNTEERTRLGENGKKYVGENHSPEVVYQQISSALSSER